MDFANVPIADFDVVGGIPKSDARHLQPHPWPQNFDRAPHCGKSLEARVQNTSDPAKPWRDLLEQFKPLSADFRLERKKPSDVAAWTREALYVTGSDRIDNHDEHDRDGPRRVLQCRKAGRAVHHDHVRREAYELPDQGSRADWLAYAPTVVDQKVAALSPAQLLQAAPEGGNAGLPLWVVLRVNNNHADAPHPLALLRARRERPRTRGAEQRDELAPPHAFPRRIRSPCRPG
jgi:hypothetical protein